MTPAERKAQQRERERLGLVLVRIGKRVYEVPTADAYRLCEALKRYAVE